VSQTNFEQFKEDKKALLAESLHSGLGDEHIPSIPSVDNADSLKEQYYCSILGVASPPLTDDIDWEGLEKELRAYAEVEWIECKQSKIKRRQLGLLNWD
jgi:hypothetical protein